MNIQDKVLNVLEDMKNSLILNSATQEEIEELERIIEYISNNNSD